eukprot:m.38481 g.38481  ORF g.38481 m.38481 type:complete len:282 (-) comp12591_c0_seq2:91-936(-)
MIIKSWVAFLAVRACLTMATSTTLTPSTAPLAPQTTNYTVAPDELLATLALRGIKINDLLSQFGGSLGDETQLLRTALSTGLRGSPLHPQLKDAELAIVALDLDQSDGVDVTLTLQPVNTSQVACALRDYVDSGNARRDLQRIVSFLSRDTITALDLLELRSCDTCTLPTNCSAFTPSTTAMPLSEATVDDEEERKPSKIMIAIVASVGGIVLIVLIVTAVKQCRTTTPPDEREAAPSFSNPVFGEQEAASTSLSFDEDDEDVDEDPEGGYLQVMGSEAMA